MTSNLTIPEKPGCYFHKNKEGEIIYIGKAKNLKKRIAQYVIKKDNTDKTNLLIQNIATTEFIITTTEYEALLLENNLIKQHSPKYNINLKDDKRYAYLTLTHETFPRLITSRRRTEEGTYFGPFVSGEARNYIYNFVNKTFKLRTCKKLPKKVCLRYHLGICTAPCVGNVSEEDYEKQIQSASEVLKGNTTKIIQDLRKDMKGFSENMQFEEALEIRKQIEALEYLDSRQNVEREKKFDEDIIAFKKKQGDIYGIVFNIHKGILVNKKEFEFSDSPDFFEEFILRFYEENPIPKEIILQYDISDALVQYLEHKKQQKVIITIPKQGEKKKLLDLVLQNIDATFFGEEEKLLALSDALELSTIPRTIECFDISHLAGTNTVASMVCFKNGKPSKENYRRFKIKTVEGIDDFRSMKEVVTRRYKRLLNEKKPLPDLIVIDGGKGQLSFAKKALDNLMINIPIIGLAKKEEEIFFPGSQTPLVLGKKHKGLQLLQSIRDEAHRFAITYNKKLREIK